MPYTIEKKRPIKKDSEKKRIEKLKQDPMYLIFGDYQKHLESTILKLNFRSFTQVVILGNASFVPFMQLRARHRRQVVEEILDIEIFSKMNFMFREKQKLQDEIIKQDDFQYSILDTKIEDKKKYIDDITTISSNFENIVVKQTNLEETKGILYNMIPMYEKFHNVKYNKDIIEDIVKLSSRFIFDKSQPAAGLDLLDECGSHIKNQISSTSEQIVQIQQKIDGIQKQKLESIQEYNFEEGVKLSLIHI